MKILLDANLSNRLVPRLDDLFTDIAHVKTFGLAHNTDDKIIWQWARDNGYMIVVSHDEDFVKLLRRHGPPPKVIRLRYGNQRNAAVVDFFRRNIDVILEFGNNEEKHLMEIFSID